MVDFLQTRINMVDGQIHPAGVVDPSILESFETVPRELFVPERLQGVAYTDKDLDIGQGRYLLEPITHAKMMQAVLPVESDVVLDIGVGAGYSTAILSPMVTMIIALEHNKRQMDKATKLWDRLDVCNVALIEGALSEGVSDQAPYSLIVINGAVEMVPDNIFDQMDIGGRLITVIRKPEQSVGQATLFIKSDNGTVSSKILFDASAPFLTGFEPKACFKF
ncbi:MAG: hypothetical protein COA45_11535 [Zetaproteobacteria bacterium]|nr:MAG: hypothetical protein COA45_11535 [Zetaproteobacteria bacterium]